MHWNSLKGSKILRNFFFGSNDKETYDRSGWLILAALTALAMAMRFYRLDSLPAGLDSDKAFNGLDALNLLNLPLTKWPIFFEGNSGREPLFVWLSGVAHALFGPSIWTARFIAALSGFFLTPALAWLGWQTAPMLGVRHRQQFSLWCATAILALLWSQIFARYGIRAILYVLVQTLMWAAMWRAWLRQAPAVGAWVIAGFLAGLSLYTYLPARLLPLVFLPLLASAISSHSQHLRLHLPGLAYGLLTALLVAAPLAIFFINNPFAFSNRIEQVGVLENRTVFSNLSAVLKMFFWSGDLRFRNNLSARPALDPLLALPFLVGVGLTLLRFWRLGRIFLLAGLSVQLLPTVLSSNAPNFLRSIGALPFIALLTAFGAESTVRFLERLRGSAFWPARALVWAVFAASVVLTNWIYFGVWASTPELFYEYDEGFTQLARQIADEREATVYVNTHGGVLHPAVFYLLAEHEGTTRFYDGQECLPVALTGPVRHFYLADGNFRSRLLASSFYPQATPKSTVIFDRTGQPWMAETRNADGEPVVFPEMRKQVVQMADGISLAGYSLSQEWIQAGHPLRVRLFWRANSTPSADYTTFIHLVQMEEDGSIARLAGFDRRPGDGNCRTNLWLPGEIIIDEVELKMPEELPQTDLFLAVGFYSVSDGSRLPVSGGAANQFLLGPLSPAP